MSGGSQLCPVVSELNNTFNGIAQGDFAMASLNGGMLGMCLMPQNSNLKAGLKLNSATKAIIIADIVNKRFKNPIAQLNPEVISLNGGNSNERKADDGSFSRSDKEDGDEGDRKGSPPKDENAEGGDDKPAASRS